MTSGNSLIGPHGLVISNSVPDDWVEDSPPKHFCRMRLWFRAGEPYWLSGSWAYALDYWSCWIGWDCPRPEMYWLRIADFMFRLFSHHHRARWGWGRGVGVCSCFIAGRKLSPKHSQAVSPPHAELWYPPRSLYDSPATYPFHLVQNVTSSLKHLCVLIVVPVFTVLLVSCAWTWAGKTFWCAY